MKTVAQTGIPAINVNGTTIHSASKLKPINKVQQLNFAFVPWSFHFIIIDETSMLTAELFDSLDCARSTGGSHQMIPNASSRNRNRLFRNLLSQPGQSHGFNAVKWAISNTVK